MKLISPNLGDINFIYYSHIVRLVNDMFRALAFQTGGYSLSP